MQAFSGNDTKIPDHAIERIARCLLPMIRAYYESAEGQAELAAWNEKKDAEDIRLSVKKTAQQISRCALTAPRFYSFYCADYGAYGPGKEGEAKIIDLT